MKRMEAGYTLLEMVLAVSIFAMVAATIGAGLMSVQQTWRKVEKHSGLLENLMLVDRVVDSAVRNAVPYKWKDDNNVEKQIFIGNKNEASFAYIHRIVETSQGGIRFIRLSLEDDKLIAAYRSSPLLSWANDEAGIKKEILAKNVREISFLYADEEDEELVWLSDWDEEENPNIPLAMQITIEWINGQKECWLRRTAGSGICQTLGKRENKKNE